MSIVTLAEAKAQLNIDAADTHDDDELQAYVDAITGVVENYKREVIEQRTVTEDLELSATRVFRLWNAPVVSLTSVQTVDGATTWDVTNMRLTSDTGMVRVRTGPPVSGLVEVVYEAGHATVPERYKRGALVILQHAWETQRGGAGPVRGGVIGADESWDPRFAFSIPRKALEWLGAPRPVVA